LIIFAKTQTINLDTKLFKLLELLNRLAEIMMKEVIANGR